MKSYASRHKAKLGLVCMTLFMLLALPSAAYGSDYDVAIGFGGDAELLIYLPVTLANELGYFEEAGLSVTLRSFQGGAQAKAAVLSGEIDIAASYYSNVVLAVARGESMMSFVTLLRYPGWVVAVSPQAAARIQGIEDLVGAVIGVSSIDSGTYSFARYLLAMADIAVGDVAFSEIGTSSGAVDAVVNGLVDVAVLYEPSVSEALAKAPDARVLVDARQGAMMPVLFGTDALPGSSLYTTPTWLAKNPEAARRLALAVARALEWIQTRTPAQIADVMPDAFKGADPDLYAQALAGMHEMFSPDGSMTLDGAKMTWQLLMASQAEGFDAGVNLENTYTNGFLP